MLAVGFHTPARFKDLKTPNLDDALSIDNDVGKTWDLIGGMRQLLDKLNVHFSLFRVCIVNRYIGCIWWIT